jgi:hypothetical protein
VFTEKYNQYLNAKTCQTASHMAPGSDVDLGNNPAMYYNFRNSTCHNYKLVVGFRTS